VAQVSLCTSKGCLITKLQLSMATLPQRPGQHACPKRSLHKARWHWRTPQQLDWPGTSSAASICLASTPSCQPTLQAARPNASTSCLSVTASHAPANTAVCHYSLPNTQLSTLQLDEQKPPDQISTSAATSTTACTTYTLFH
jgi:hypothetical protein